MIDLALTLGCTVSELEERVTVDEMEELGRYANENGGISPHRRLERATREGAALICLVMATINAPKGKKYKLEDFLPVVERVLEEQDEVKAVEGLLKAMGGGKAGRGQSIGNSGIKWRRKASGRG